MVRHKAKIFEYGANIYILFLFSQIRPEFISKRLVFLINYGLWRYVVEHKFMYNLPITKYKWPRTPTSPKIRYTTEYQRSTVSFKILSLETRVSLKGNGSSLIEKLEFPTRGTEVSLKGHFGRNEGEQELLLRRNAVPLNGIAISVKKEVREYKNKNAFFQSKECILV